MPGKMLVKNMIPSDPIPKPSIKAVATPTIDTELPRQRPNLPIVNAIINQLTEPIANAAAHDQKSARVMSISCTRMLVAIRPCRG